MKNCTNKRPSKVTRVKCISHGPLDITLGQSIKCCRRNGENFRVRCPLNLRIPLTHSSARLAVPSTHSEWFSRPAASRWMGCIFEFLLRHLPKNWKWNTVPKTTEDTLCCKMLLARTYIHKTSGRMQSSGIIESMEKISHFQGENLTGTVKLNRRIPQEWCTRTDLGVLKHLNIRTPSHLWTCKNKNDESICKPIKFWNPKY